MTAHRRIADGAFACMHPPPKLIRTAAAFVLGLVLISAAPRGAGAEAQSITGNWATAFFGSIVQIRPCTDAPATMCGRIVWLWAPNDGQGRPRVDTHNPDQALRSRALVGVEIVRGLHQADATHWRGDLYNPNDGRTYSGEIKLNGAALELRGCALTVFCETQVWRRAEDVIAAVRSLPQ